MTSLFTALSGLRANQGWIDVVGNNLANTNTMGFKTSRATFSDHFAQTLRYASGPSGSQGGINPMQIGHGVRLGDIARNFSQGALTDTGRTFDLALNGEGFFALSEGSDTLFSRVGTFGLDALNSLVDLRTGFNVLNPSGSPVQLDVESLFPPQGSENVELSGNLPGTVTGPRAEVLTASTGFAHGHPALLTGTNAGGSWPAIPSGDTWTMSVTINSGAPQPVAIAGTGVPVTPADVAAAIDALPDVSASVTTSNTIEVSSNLTGEAVTMKINPGEAGKDLASMLGISTTLVTGSQTPIISGLTTLNDLPGNNSDYSDGDIINVTGVDTDGSPINASFQFGATGSGFNGTTIDEFVAFVDNLYSDAQVSLNAAGQLVVEAQTSGEADLLLAFTDETGQVGSTDWTTYAAAVTTDGTGPDTVVTSTEVYDESGAAHTLTLTFERQDDGTWTANPALDPDSGSVLSAPITGLNFNDQGAPIGLGAVNKTMTLQFTGQSGSQDVSLDLGSDGLFDGLTQFGSETNVFVSAQDGYSAGELASLTVDTSGVIHGFYTNGQTQELGAVGIATHANTEGLREYGDNLWARSPNSGTYVLGAGDIGAAGKVIGGSLENSNVDTAEQFVHLIEAQRGYQANSRVISIQDEILSETVNLI